MAPPRGLPFPSTSHDASAARHGRSGEGQIERGVITPSVSTLRKIADAFGITVATLFDQAERPGANQRKAVRRHERRIITYPGSRIESQLLAPDLRRKMEPFRVRARPGIKSPVYVHDGEEFALVLMGTMTIWVGDERFVLKARDAIYLESSVPHASRSGWISRIRS